MGYLILETFIYKLVHARLFLKTNASGGKNFQAFGLCHENAKEDLMATSAALDRTNLYSQVFWNFYNLINDRSNVVDPHPGGAGGSRKFVYSDMPEVTSHSFAGFPFVVVNPAGVRMEGIRTGDDKNSGVTGTVAVEVYAVDFPRDRNAGNPLRTGLAQVDSISDDIIQTFNSSSTRDTLRGNNIGFVEVEGGGSDPPLMVNNKRTYLRELNIRFDTKLLAVSA